jgi:uncharacterized membrane protein
MRLDVNFAHIHLLLNHFPIIGTMIGLALLLVSFVGKNEDLRRSSYIVLAGIGLLVIPTFCTGFGAQQMIQNQPGVSNALIQRHEGAAMLSLWFMMATGAFAFVGLWQTHERSRPARWNVAAVLILSLLTMGLMARVGNTGGDIRHPEDGTTIHGTTVVEGTMGSIIHVFEPDPDNFIRLMGVNDIWWWCLMGLHFLGLALIIGTVGILDLRIMGFFKQIPMAPLLRFIPFAMAGLGVNILTGMMAFCANNLTYTYSLAFWLKLIVLMLLGVNAAAFYMTDVADRVEHLGAGEDAPMYVKLVAGSALVLCFGLIVFGRYIQPMVDSIRNPNN